MIDEQTLSVSAVLVTNNVVVPMIDSLRLLDPVCYNSFGISIYCVLMETREHDKLGYTTCIYIKLTINEKKMCKNGY